MLKKHNYEELLSNVSIQDIAELFGIQEVTLHFKLGYLRLTLKKTGAEKILNPETPHMNRILNIIEDGAKISLTVTSRQTIVIDIKAKD